MRIYECKKEYGDYAQPYIDSEEFGDKLTSFFGKKIEDWAVQKGKWDKEEGEKKADITFFFGYIPACNEKVYGVLQKENIPFLDYLPIDIDGERYYIMNILHQEQGLLNLEQSKVKKFSDGSLYYVEKYVFEEVEQLASILFQIEEMKTSFFCTDAFVKIIKENAFEGIVFEECKINRLNIIEKLIKKR